MLFSAPVDARGDSGRACQFNELHWPFRQTANQRIITSSSSSNSSSSSSNNNNNNNSRLSPFPFSAMALETKMRAIIASDGSEIDTKTCRPPIRMRTLSLRFLSLSLFSSRLSDFLSVADGE